MESELSPPHVYSVRYGRIPCRNDYVNTSPVGLFLCALLDLYTYTYTDDQTMMK